MKVTLVMGTLGQRPDEIRRFATSIREGTHQDFELIIVDQSSDGGARSLVEEMGGCSDRVIYLRAEPGLSRARNRGLDRASGDLVGFPDDDCWYPEGLLASVVARFRSQPSLGALAGHPIDPEGHSSFPRSDLKAGWVDRYNIWRRANSNALFVKREVIRIVGGFDELLGIGAGTPWGAAEDVDYPLRILTAGFPIYYDPHLLVYHPMVRVRSDDSGRRLAKNYAGGMGRVLRKHGYPYWFASYQAIRPLGGALLSLLQGKAHKARYHWAIFRGRVSGWFAS